VFSGKKTVTARAVISPPLDGYGPEGYILVVIGKRALLFFLALMLAAPPQA